VSQKQARSRVAADRRRLGRPVDRSDDLGADIHAHTNLYTFSKIAITGAIEAIPKVDTPVIQRGPHSRHLTLIGLQKTYENTSKM